MTSVLFSAKVNPSKRFDNGKKEKFFFKLPGENQHREGKLDFVPEAVLGVGHGGGNNAHAEGGNKADPPHVLICDPQGLEIYGHYSLPGCLKLQ